MNEFGASDVPDDKPSLGGAAVSCRFITARYSANETFNLSRNHADQIDDLTWLGIFLTIYQVTSS